MHEIPHVCNPIYDAGQQPYQRSHQGATSAQTSRYLSSLSSRRSSIESGCPEWKALYRASTGTQASNSFESADRLELCTERSRRIFLQGQSGLCHRTIDGFCHRAACGSGRVSCRFQTDGWRANRCRRTNHTNRCQTIFRQNPWGMMDMVWVGFRDLLGISSSALGDGRDQRMLIRSPRGKCVARPRRQDSLYRPGSP